MKRAWVCVFGLASVTAAHAQPGAAPDEPPPPPPVEAGPPPTAPAPPPMVAAPVPVPPASTVERGTLEDANAGRVAIMPTALTAPAGTWSFEDLELFVIGASYSPTDQLVITATTMIPVTSDLYWGFLSGKYQFLNQGRLRLAFQAGIAGVLAKDTTTTYDTSGNPISETRSNTGTSGLELGGAATLCLDDDCYSHVDAAVVAGFAHQDQSSVPVGFMGGLVARLGKRVRLILEADTAHLFGDLSGQANGLLAWYGVRFTSRQIGVDIALVKPFCDSDCNSSTLPLGLPFVTFSYRGLD